MKLIAFIFLLAASSELFAQSPGNSLPGFVIDSAGNKPLSDVSIFLNNTSKGTVSRADGSFLLKNIPQGQYQLVISAIGYETVVIDLNGHHLPSSLKVTLKQKVTELTALIVEPEVKEGWRRWGKFFIDNFIGTVENARSCRITNSGVLHFHFYQKSNRLTVTATGPLIIKNKALGYILQYKLEGFSCDFNAQVVFYSGYPYFQEMTTTKRNQQVRWEEHREKAYTGSVMHFMRSLYADHLLQDGFIVRQQIKEPNEEKRRVINATGSSLFMSLPDTSQQAKDLVANNIKIFSFDDTLDIRFPAWGNAGSQLRLVEPTVIGLEENGNYYPPQKLMTYGFWSQSEKIANLLPLDYGRH